MNNTEYDFSAAADAAREKMQQAVCSVREHTDGAVARGTRYVQERPAASLLAVFAAGMALGVVVAVAIRDPEPRAALADSLDDSRSRVADFLGTLAENLRGPFSKTYASASDSVSELTDVVARALEKVHPPKKFVWW